MANTIKESKGVTSQKDIVTRLRCPICNNLMLQNEISVEIAFRHSRRPGRCAAPSSWWTRGTAASATRAATRAGRAARPPG